MQRVVALGSVLVAAGCGAASRADETTWVAAPGHEPAMGVPPLVRYAPPPSFLLELEVDGTLRPGDTVHVTLLATATGDVPDGELRVTLPEVAAAEESSWDIVILPVDREIRPHLELRRSFTEGEKIRQTFGVMIPEAGYYHVLATGYRHSSRRDPNVPDVSRREYWLWIAEEGGRVTERFDTTLFAEGDRRQTGPLGSELYPSRTRSEGSPATCRVVGPDGRVSLYSGACPP